MDIHEKFHIVPEGSEGTKRAVMIGINYEGQAGELSGCQNDVNHVSASFISLQNMCLSTNTRLNPHHFFLVQY